MHLSSASCHFPFRVRTPAISSLAYCAPNAAGPAPTRLPGHPAARSRQGRPGEEEWCPGSGWDFHAAGPAGLQDGLRRRRVSGRGPARRDGPLGLGLHRLCLRRGQDVWVTVVLRWGSPRLLDPQCCWWDFLSLTSIVPERGPRILNPSIPVSIKC